jgi:hypothetical protein
MFANNISVGKTVFHQNTESNRLLIQRLENRISNSVLNAVLDYESRTANLMKKPLPTHSMRTALEFAIPIHENSNDVTRDPYCRVKPEIKTYIALYGMPEDGSFDSKILGELSANKI